jgi:transcriptional adapter 2-alpha
MQERDHKHPVMVGEWSEWMPWRHEFDKEKDFMHDAEILVDTLSLDERETAESFAEKMERLHAYNSVLAERQFRTQVVEDWKIPLLELKEKKGPKGDEFEAPLPMLGGPSKEARAVDEQLTPLGPYLGPTKTKELARELHDRMKTIGHIRSCFAWQAEGIRTIEEGKLRDSLREHIAELSKSREDSKLILSWNDKIDRYNEQLAQRAALGEHALLDPEKELCRKTGTDAQMYLAMKDFLIREFTAVGACRLGVIKTVIPANLHGTLTDVHRFCMDNGWIVE